MRKRIVVLLSAILLFVIPVEDFGECGEVPHFTNGNRYYEKTFKENGGNFTVQISLPATSRVSRAILSIEGKEYPRYGSIIHEGLQDFSTGIMTNLSFHMNMMVRDPLKSRLSEKVTYEVGSLPHSVAVGDVNGDGKMDVVVCNQGFSSNSTGVLLQKDNGELMSMKEYPLPGAPNKVAIGDVNNDGRDDVVVTYIKSDLSGSIAILLQDASGNLGPPQTMYAGYYPDGVAIGDLNNDDRNDVVVAQWLGMCVAVFYQDSLGHLSPFTQYSTGMTPRNVAIGDFNSDGLNDIAVTNCDDNTTGILLQVQGGGFQPIKKYECLPYPVGIATGDFNSDGRDDIIITSLGDNKTQVFIQKGDGTMTSSQILGISAGYPMSVAAGDVTGDGRDDAVVTNFDDQKLINVYMQSLKRKLVTAAYISGSYPDGVAIGDVNADGLNDVVVSNYAENSISILYQKNFIGTYLSKVYEMPLNVEKVVCTWEEEVKGKPIRFFISADSGENWIEVQKDNEVQLNGKYLRYKMVFEDESLLKKVIINYTLVERYPSKVKVDVGNDGTYEWEASELMGKNDLPDLSEAINEYIEMHQAEVDSEGNVSIPIVVGTRTAGTINMSIVDINYNTAPTIISYQPNVRVVDMMEGDMKNFTVSAKDTDGDKIEIRWLLNGSEVGKGAKYVLYADYDMAGEYDLTAEVSDASLKSNMTWHIIIRDVNRPPHIKSYSPKEDELKVEVDREVKFSIKVDDPDNDEIKVKWTVNDNEVTGVEKEDNLFVLIMKWGFNEVDKFTIRATCTDGKDYVHRLWNVTTVYVNAITKYKWISPMENQSIDEGENITFEINDEKVKEIMGSYQSFFLINDIIVGRGIAYTFETNYTSSGEYVFQVVIKNATLRFAYKIWINVEEVNNPPRINSTNPTQHEIMMNEGETKVFFLKIDDTDGDVLQYKWYLNGEIVSAENEYKFSPSYDDAGEYNLTVEVTDGYSTVKYTWHIIVKNKEPESSPFENTMFLVGISIVLLIMIGIAVGSIYYVYRHSDKMSILSEKLARKIGGDELTDVALEAERKREEERLKMMQIEDEKKKVIEKKKYPCQNCGGLVDEDWFVCHHCSAPLLVETLDLKAYEGELEDDEIDAIEKALRRAKEAVEQQTCEVCGRYVEETWEACPTCATPIKREIEHLKCKNCGESIEKEWDVCPGCGAQLKITCSSCGRDVSSKWVRCPYCRASLISVDKCPSCGEIIEPDWTTCPACGGALIEEKVDEEEVKRLTCPACGEDIEEDWLACPNCSVRLKDEVFEESAEQIKEKLKELESRIKMARVTSDDQKKAMQMLQIAAAFVKIGKLDKVKKYVNKVEEILKLEK